MQKTTKCKGIVKNIKNKIAVVLAVAIAAVIATIFYTSVFVSPVYKSTAAICLKYSDEGDFNCDDPYKYVNDCVDMFIFSISTQGAKDLAEETLSKKDQRYGKVNIDSTEIEAWQHDDTNIIYISVTSTEDILSCDLCNVYTEISSVYAGKLGNIKVSVIEPPTKAEAQSYDGVIKNSVIFSRSAAVVTIIIIVIVSLTDKKIKDGKEAEKQTDILFLGYIPNINEKLNK